MVDRSDRDPPNLINGPGFELALELEVTDRLGCRFISGLFCKP